MTGTSCRQTADRPDPPGDHGGLAGLGHEHLQDRIGVPDELLAADRRATGQVQPRPESIAALRPLDEAELGQRAQVAVDGREGRLEQRAQLVGADLAAVGDRQEHAQPTRERGVLGSFFGRAVAAVDKGGPKAQAGRSEYRSRAEERPPRASAILRS